MRPTGSRGLPRFESGADGEFLFDTGVLKGILRADGSSRGISSVEHLRTGRRLDGGPGIMGFYRVFTTNHRYGTAAWDWPSEGRLLSDGAVEVEWPPADERPFQLRTLYQWVDARTLDLEITVSALEDLPDFELFVASYFQEFLSDPMVYVQAQDSSEARFMEALQVKGDWQTFLRDKEGLPVFRDGRWNKPPNPVDWVIRPMLARPVCLRGGDSSGIRVLLMAPESDCFAISTPYAGEAHYSLYLSLFGYDVKAGTSASARARFMVLDGESGPELEEIIESYP
jgi:hypothetical protein